MTTELLVVTTLYPNSRQQRHGIFVETRLRHLLDSGGFSATVIAPVPWFPASLSRLRRFSRYAALANIPREEERHGLRILHPRYLVIPKVGMLLAPFTLALSVASAVRSLRQQGRRFDIVDAHYYYPDGVAVALLRRYLDCPITITARGTDINLIPEYRLPRRLICWAANRAAASITVCAALKQRMAELGIDAGKIHVLRNGVDLDLFRPMDRALCRQKFGITGKTLVSVGHLIPRKGHDLVIEALTFLPDYQLLLVGDGEQDQQLRTLAQRLGVQERVRFVGAVVQAELAEIYSAADIMVLASSREGWANVLLESMACGTPVVASNIWGTPEVVCAPEAGMLLPARTGEAIARAVEQLMACYPDRAETRRFAESYSWQDTVAGLKRLFGGLLSIGDVGKDVSGTELKRKKT